MVNDRIEKPDPSSPPPSPEAEHVHHGRMWHRRMSWISLGASLGVHLVLVLSSLVNVAVARVGSEHGRPDGDFELTVTNEAPLTEVDDSAVIETASPAVNTPSELPDLPTSGVMEGSGGFDAPASGEGLGEVADGLGGAGGGDIGEGSGLGGTSGGGSTKFFGVEARGSRFAYVVDVSGSMGYENGKKLNELKKQLKGSLSGMLEHMSYYVIAFNQDSQVISGGKFAWIKATNDQKSIVLEKVDGLKADGGTSPLKPLEQVFKLGARPDAIYFMTDGAFDDSPADVNSMLARVNKGARKVPIHCIGFGDAVDEEVLRRIANDSGGSYRHVKGPR